MSELQVSKTCANKGCQEKASNRCGQCGMVSYCGRKCQEEHWSEHKKECKTLKNKAAGSSATNSPSVSLVADPNGDASSVQAIVVKLQDYKNKFLALRSQPQTLKAASEFGGQNGEYMKCLLAFDKEPARSQLLIDHYKHMFNLFTQMQDVTQAENYANLLVPVAENYFSLYPTLQVTSVNKPPNNYFVLADARFIKLTTLFMTKKYDLVNSYGEEILELAAKIPDVNAKDMITMRVLFHIALANFELKNISKFDSYVDQYLEIAAQSSIFTPDSNQTFRSFMQCYFQLRVPARQEKVCRVSYNIALRNSKATLSSSQPGAAEMSKTFDIMLSEQAVSLGRLIYNQVGRKGESRKYFEESLAIRQKYFDKDHPFIKECLNFLEAPEENKSEIEERYESLLNMKDFQAACDFGSTELLKHYETLPEPLRYFRLIKLYSFLIDWNLQAGYTENKPEKISAGKKYLADCFATAEKYYNLTANYTPELYSAQIPNTKMEDSDRNKVLGQANFLKCKELHHEKKYAEAEPFGAECLRLYKLVFKKVDHPILLGVYTLLGSTQAGLQKYNEADVHFNLSVQSLSKSELDSENYIDCLELCWQSFNVKLDPSNSQIQVVVGLAIKYLKLLLESLKRVLDKFKSKNAPPEAIKPVEARVEAVTFNLAIQYFKLGRPDDSVPLLEDSLVIRRKYLGKNDINIGMSLFMIAEANFFLNRRENLVSQFESAYNIFLEIDGKEADQYSNKCFQYIRRLNDENAAASKADSKLKNQSSSSSSPVSSLNAKSLGADDVQGRLSLIDAYVRANDLSNANELLKQTIVICKKNPTVYPAEQIAKLEMKLKRFDDTLHGIMIGECFNEYLEAFKTVDISDVSFAFEFTGVLNNSKNHQILSNADVDKHRMIKMVSITQNSSETGK